MKKLTFLLLLSITTVFSQRVTTKLQKDWKFKKGNNANAYKSNFNDTNWDNILLPHDWAIGENFIKDGDGSTGKLPWKDEGWYRTTFTTKANKTYYLLFDGVMAFPKIYVNGKLVGEWDYGYNSFYLDITEFIKNGKNSLAVHASTLNHDSRWYPGGGIYRKVQLIEVNPVHVGVWGTYVTTPIVKPNYADVRISTNIINSTSTETTISVLQQIVSNEGVMIAENQSNTIMNPSSSKEVETTIQLQNPIKWDIDNPYLYKLKTQLLINSKVIDEYETSFGIRTIKFTADDGFYLNDKRVQLKGVNLHHDHGPLGAAFNYRAMERQLQIMKSLGVNAIRNSHNTAAPELLDLCDKMGLLFFNEVFDKYDAKADILSSTDFEEFAHRNIKNFVVRDRNHPSVFIWSVGNEIGDVQSNENRGFARLHTMLNYVNKYDPTRPTTLVNDKLESASLRHFDYYDVHSWNYGRRYRLARQLEPNKSVIISESASTLSTRGFYEFPLPKEKTDFTNSLQVSSYDLNAPWWAEIADDDFMWQQDESYVAGEFVWTGFDYLGEPTPYENSKVIDRGMTDNEASRSSYFGIVDLVGIPKDRYYLYKSYWKPEEKTIHILPHWNWEGREGEITPVFVYTNGDCATLFVNEKSYETKCKNPSSKNSVERFRLMWNDVVYEPGEVKVIAYKDGKILGENSVKTTGKTTQLKATLDVETLYSNGEDLSYVLLEALDNEGNSHPLAANKIHIQINNPEIIKIAGVGNGNPQSFEPFQSDNVYLFNGKAMVILSSKFVKGTSTITFTAEGLKETKVTVRVE